MDSISPEELEHRRWLASLVAPVGEGEVLVDFGCGNGKDLQLIADRNSDANARFVGVDHSVQALESARSLLRADSRVQLLKHDLRQSLPFAGPTLDIAYSNNLLECLGNKRHFLRELADTLKPGGHIVFAHWDWDTQVFNGSDKELLREVLHTFSDWQQPWMDHCDGWMGRRLWGTFADTGAFEGDVLARTMCGTTFGPDSYGYDRLLNLRELVTSGRLAQESYDTLWKEQEELAAAGQFFHSITAYVFVGKRT
ncbi:MAG: methyltransferase domain-containing protein [Myxococcota bacterium]